MSAFWNFQFARADGLPENIVYSKTGACFEADVTTITVSPVPTICANTSSVNLLATVSPEPGSGTVQFQIDGANAGSPAALSGNTASFLFNPSSLTPGNHSVTAIFSGNSAYSGSTSPAVTFAINQINPGSIAKGASNQGMVCAPLNPNVTLVPNGSSSIAATGTGVITYLWQQSTDAGASWVPAVVASPETSNTNVQFNPGPMNTTTRLRRVAMSTLNSVVCTANSNELEYIVYPLPTVAPISPPTSNPINICEGGTVQLTNATSGGIWSSNNLSSVTVNSAGVVTGVSASASHTQNISYTVTDNHGCSRTVNRTITVNGLPAITFNPSVCVQGTFNLTPDTGGAWVSNNAGVATVSNSGLVTGVSPGNASFTFTNGTAPGCSKTTPLISVNPEPAATINSHDIEICQGESTDIEGSIAAFGNWTITMSDGSTASGTGNGSFTIPVTPNLTTTYTITSLVAEDCHAGLTKLTGSVTVNVKDIPAGPMIQVLDNCDGTSVLTASDYTGTLLWSTNEFSESVKVTTAGSYSVTQTVNGCTSTESSATANPKFFPSEPVVSSPITYCQNSTATQLTAAGTDLLWYETVTAGTGNSIAPVPQTAIPGNTDYYVSQTNNGCESERASITVKVKDDCPPMPVTLTEFVVRNKENRILIAWKTTSETNSSRFEIERSTIPAKGFSKIATVVTSDDPSGSSYSYTDTNLVSDDIHYYRLKMVDKDETFAYSQIQKVRLSPVLTTKIYPNPASETINIKTDDWHRVNAIRVHDVNGGLIYQAIGENLNTAPDVSKFPAGLYFLEIVRKTGVSEFKRFVVAH